MKLDGVMPVMVLPLREDETIDETALRREVDFSINAGAVGICAPGFATEFYKLTDEERRLVIQVVAEQTAGRVPVIASTGCGSARATLELSRYAQSAGADGLMVVAPKWVPLGAPEQAIFFEEICRNVNLPVMLQDADFAGAGLPASLIVELAERCPTLKFAKLENVLAGAKCAEIVRSSGGKVQVLYGMAGIALLDGLAHGAVGVMPGPSFVKAYARVFELYGSGRIEEAKALFYRMQPYLTFSMQHVEIVIQMDKRALVRQDVFSSDRMREPTLHLDPAYQKQMDDLIDLMLGLCDEIKPAGDAAKSFH
jgi:dihydrodipicolinate synthase/N-acetylneuraminate lyase